MKAQTATIYSLIKPTAFWLEIPLLLGFNLLLVACAYISVPLPLVPVTGQTFGVLLVAMALGRVRGSAVVLAYLLEGACGLPVFAEGKAGLQVFLGPTGGYLVGFLMAAFVTGQLAERTWDKTYLKSVTAMVLGTVVIYVCGLAWLGRFVPADSLLDVGLLPFIPGAFIKITLAAIVLPSVWKFVRPEGGAG